jgi:MerR family redox-sensitive transcriptional activator SoxR
MRPERITISELSARSGVAASALRYYEALGLISAERSGGNQRRYARSTLRRVAVIRVAQSVGLSLETIRAALDALPHDRELTAADWERLSAGWRRDLDRRIDALQGLRDRLSSCIGCGCLSLGRCALFNPGDVASAKGAGARYLLGDVAPQPGTSIEGASPAAPVRAKRRTTRNAG